MGHLVRFSDFRGLKTWQEGADVSRAGAMRWLVALLLVFFFSSAAQAQLYTGSVTGVVTDPSGAVVPGAKVTLTDQNKGYSFTATTDPTTGRYVLRSIPPGTYKITIEAPNFQGQTREGIVLDVSQNVSVDFSLKVGTATEVVEVKGAAVQLQTEDAVTGQVVNRRFVNDLPLVDRDFANLAFLAPGIVETNAPFSKSSQGGINFNSNGSRNATADVLIDGASASNFDQNSGINNVPYTPSVDSVEEFKVQQTNFSAEYGFAGGTIINVVTRSGSNQFHGGLGEFFRNSVMDANDWFNNANKVPISPLKRNNFGGTIGGPIRKDKTFFFFDYEGSRQTTASSSGLMGVPSLCERGEGPCPAGASALGNFSELCTTQADSFGQNAHFSAQGQCVDSQNNLFPSGQLWDPYSATFQNNPPQLDPNVTLGAGAVRPPNGFIPFNDLSSYTSLPSLPGSATLAAAGAPGLPSGPGNLIDPVARKLFLLFPRPTVNATDLFTLQNANFFTAGSSRNSSDQFDVKVDHRFNDRNMLSVRYSQERGSSSSLNCFGNFADPCTGGPVNFTRHEAAVNYSHTFSPRVALTITYGLVRAFDFQHGVQGNFPNISSSFTQLGFPAYLNNFGTIPAIQISGYSSGNSGNNIGTQTFSVLREGQDAHHLEGAVSWIRGKHELKIGGEGRLHRINFVQPGWPSGDFSFDSTATSEISSESNTTSNGFPFLGGDGLASFLIGVGPPGQSGGGCTPCQQGFNNFVSTQSIRFGTFVQDNFKVTPKLTLNLGMRYELSFPRTERYNRMNWLDPNAASPLQLTAPQLAVVQSLGLPAQAVQTLSSLHGIEVFASPKDRYNYFTDHKDIQPRFGFAYQLPHALVVRGGYGIYFSTPRNSAAGTGPWGFEGFNIQPPWLTTFNIDHVTPYNRLSNTACVFFAPFNCGLALPPSTLRTLNSFNDLGFAAVGPIRQESLNTPYEQAWSLGFQKELPGKILVDATYIGKKGTHLYLGGFREHNYIPPSFLAGLSLDPTAPNFIGNLTNTVTNPFFFNGPGNLCDSTKFICDPSSGLAGPTITQSQLLVPFPQYNGFQGDSPPIANSMYHALQIRAEKEFSNGLQFLATYTWSKSIDNASAGDDSFSFLGGGTPGGSTLTVQNPFNLAGEKAVSVFDLSQLVQLSFVYELPVGRGRWLGKNMHPILNAIVGGWQANGIVRIDNGRPIIPLLRNGTAIPTYGQRPDLTGQLLRGPGSPEQASITNANSMGYFSNSNVLSTPASFTFGSAPRTIASVRQPGARDVSMSIFKEFPLAKVREGMRLQFRAESFNTFNHPHFQGPNASVGSSSFGLIDSTVNNPRELQLALKLYF